MSEKEAKYVHVKMPKALWQQLSRVQLELSQERGEMVTKIETLKYLISLHRRRKEGE